ncbi:MAG: hypothetical protein KAQ98_06210 [Bacteriovoracaceae bacterium]|nr:hypothetical protein [Bacteriovoracaceae bacterium]
MKKITLLLLVFAFAYGCSTARPIAATSNKIGKHRGEACAINVLGFIPISTDASIFAAAKKGHLKEITTVDYEGFFSFFYNKDCTVVHGHK